MRTAMDGQMGPRRSQSVRPPLPRPGQTIVLTPGQEKFYTDMIAVMLQQVNWGRRDWAISNARKLLKFVRDFHLAAFDWLTKFDAPYRVASDCAYNIERSEILNWLREVRGALVKLDDGGDSFREFRELLQYSYFSHRSQEILNSDVLANSDLEIVPHRESKIVETIRPLILARDTGDVLQRGKYRLDIIAEVQEHMTRLIKFETAERQKLQTKLERLEAKFAARKMPAALCELRDAPTLDLPWLTWLCKAYVELIDSHGSLEPADKYVQDACLFRRDFAKFKAAAACVDQGSRAADWLRNRLTRIFPAPAADAQKEAWVDWWSAMRLSSRHPQEIPDESQLSTALEIGRASCR